MFQFHGFWNFGRRTTTRSKRVQRHGSRHYNNHLMEDVESGGHVLQPCVAGHLAITSDGSAK